MNIKPYDNRIQQLFLSAFYKIPRFQRSYSWDKGNIEDFWADVILSGKIGHFIGSMVLYAGKSTQELFVVDGQQRLTTITIFLAALRDMFIEVGEAALATGIQSFIERVDISAKKRYVLRTETSYPYFQEHIQKQGAAELELKPSEEEKGIQAGYDFALSNFRAIIGEVKAANPIINRQKAAVRKRLEGFRDALLSLNVIIIQLDTEDDAYVVFETLNTRGKDLEAKDLIKNLLTKLLPTKSADVDPAKIKWNKMVTDLSESAASLNASTYLHHYWLSRFDYTPERTLFEKVKKHVTKENAPGFLDGIVKDVATYRRIFEPDNVSWEKEEQSLRASLAALNIFKVRQPTPLILAILRAYFGKKITLKQARAAISSIERFHFMYTAVAGQSSSGGVSKMYAAAARDLSNVSDEQGRAKLLQDFRGKLKSRLPEEVAFAAGFSQLHYSQSDTRDRPLIRYILQKIDAHLRKDSTVDYSKMTIEHIAAQKPPTGGTPVTRFSEIGNLVFVSEGLNGEKLKNKRFAEKKKIMTDAGVPLDQSISQATNWGDIEIKARTAALAALLFKQDI